MRQLRDAAATERAAGILTDLIATGVGVKPAERPAHAKPQYYRGALVRSRKP